MADTAPSAVLFDIDGTLVDSNYAHIDAWWRACHTAGQDVDAWRVSRLIGMDSSMLLERLLGSSDSDLAQQARTYHDAYYAEHFAELHLLPGVRELLTEIADRGHAVVLATSSPENELAVLRELLDIEGALWAVTSGEDVDTAKPDPGIVAQALGEAGVAPGHAVMVGDAIWDVQAAGRAGVACIGVRSGGIAASELMEAGAVVVYDDPAHILRELDAGPIGRLRR